MVFKCADFVTNESFKKCLKENRKIKQNSDEQKNPIEKLKCNFCLPDIEKHVNAQPTHLTKINKTQDTRNKPPLGKCTVKSSSATLAAPP